jgi:hypothetical protein
MVKPAVVSFANRLPLLWQSCVTSLFAECQLCALQQKQAACKFHLCGVIFVLIRQPITLALVGSLYGKYFLS